MTKDDSKLLYGIAILFMMLLHVVAGNMFSVKSLFVPDKALTLVAMFGKICVSIYAFISGFGLWKTYEKLEDKSIQNLSAVIIKRLVKFWKVYWPVCIMAAIEKAVYLHVFDLFEFVKNMIGLSSSYNPACWYVIYYEVMIIAVFPVMAIFINQVEIKIGKQIVKLGWRHWDINSVLYVVQLIIMAVICIILDMYFNKTGLLSVFVFVSGMIFATKGGHRLWAPLWCKKSIMCFAGITGLILRCTYTGDGRIMLDLIAVPMMIPLVCRGVGKSEVLYKGLRFVGVYSFLMWLTHSLLYIYDNRFIMLMPDALTAWLVLGLLTLVLSIVLNEVFNALYQLLRKIYLRKFWAN